MLLGWTEVVGSEEKEKEKTRDDLHGKWGDVQVGNSGLIREERKPTEVGLFADM